MVWNFVGRHLRNVSDYGERIREVSKVCLVGVFIPFADEDRFYVGIERLLESEAYAANSSE